MVELVRACWQEYLPLSHLSVVLILAGSVGVVFHLVDSVVGSWTLRRPWRQLVRRHIWSLLVVTMVLACPEVIFLYGILTLLIGSYLLLAACWCAVFGSADFVADPAKLKRVYQHFRAARRATTGELTYRKD